MCRLHCLSGKAMDYCARILKRSPDIPYRSLLSKLKGRFGAELQASAKAKFVQATQERSETLKDWEDQIQALAAEAYRNLSEEYSKPAGPRLVLPGFSRYKCGPQCVYMQAQTDRGGHELHSPLQTFQKGHG